MCKKTIEKAAEKKEEVLAEWNKKSKSITITYDSRASNAEAVLQRVAAVGYDNEKFKAEDSTYDARPKCCH
jgi:hypothetical protein